jgi:single-strand DNA-binding protein
MRKARPDQVAPGGGFGGGRTAAAAGPPPDDPWATPGNTASAGGWGNGPDSEPPF